MTEVFEGEIDRLLVFAGQSGSGKTTFLENPEERLSSDQLPDEIADFHELGQEHIDLMYLHKLDQKKFDQVCIHVDLTNPVRWLDSRPNNRDKLLAEIEPSMFSRWHELENCLNRASEIHFITFFVRREENFRRWVSRGLMGDPDSVFLKRVVAVNGDVTNHSELHRQVYRAWHGFEQNFSAKSRHIIDGNSTTYSFLSESDYENEINGAYKT